MGAGAKTQPEQAVQAEEVREGEQPVLRGRGAAGGRPRRQRAGREIGRATTDRFLAELAATCNVTHAAQVAGVSVCGMYAKRRREPALAQAWEAAVDEGYGRLELLLLQRAVEGYAPAGDVAPIVGAASPALSERAVLQLLERHGRSVAARRAERAALAAAERGAADDSGVRDRLDTKLVLIAARLAGEEEAAALAAYAARHDD